MPALYRQSLLPETSRRLRELILLNSFSSLISKLYEGDTVDLPSIAGLAPIRKVLGLEACSLRVLYLCRRTSSESNLVQETN